MKHPLVGTVQVVWDTHLYPGRDDRRTGNVQFWKQALIMDVQDAPLAHNATATVKFLHNERISRGHFLTGMNHSRGCIGYPGVAAEPPPHADHPRCRWCKQNTPCPCKMRSEAAQCPLSL